MRKMIQCTNPTLKKLCKEAIMVETLNDHILAYLPPHLRAHCQVGHLKQGCLLLLLHNPALSTELHYQLPGLRDTLRRDAKLHQLSSIKVQLLRVD